VRLSGPFPQGKSQLLLHNKLPHALTNRGNKPDVQKEKKFPVFVATKKKTLTNSQRHEGEAQRWNAQGGGTDNDYIDL